MNSVEVLQQERDKLLAMVKVLDNSIAALSGHLGQIAKTKKGTMSAARRRNLSIALKKSWAERRKKKAGKS